MCSNGDGAAWCAANVQMVLRGVLWLLEDVVTLQQRKILI